MIIGNQASKSFQLFDSYTQITTEYKDQHSVLMAYFRKLYLEDQIPSIDLLCVTYHDKIIRVPEELLDAWLRKQFALEVQVRLLGSDIIELESYIEAEGYEVRFDRNPNVAYNGGIDWGFYYTTLTPYNGRYVKFGYGATRNESLAHAFMR